MPITLALSVDFFRSFAVLTRSIQHRVTEFMSRFQRDPNLPGFRLEKLEGGDADKIYSVRVNDTYRIILAREETSDVYVLLWVDHHDKAYQWAKRRRIDVNELTGEVRIYPVLEAPAPSAPIITVKDLSLPPAQVTPVSPPLAPPIEATPVSPPLAPPIDAALVSEPLATQIGAEPVIEAALANPSLAPPIGAEPTSPAISPPIDAEPKSSALAPLVDDLAKKPLFAALSDQDLLDLYLPAELIEYVRHLIEAKEFEESGYIIPKDAFENLTWALHGIPLDEIIALASEGGEKPKKPETDLARALTTPGSLRNFYIVESEEELWRVMSEPLAFWRIFLHPRQRSLATKKFAGPARVLGGAGTGKTVVAMHRAKTLASRLNDDENILFTTFTVNLAADIQENLRKICSPAELKRIEVANLDSFVGRFLKENGYPHAIIYDDRLKSIWAEAILGAGVEVEFSPSFLVDEWNKVVADQEAFSKEAYLKASRLGRGTKLNRQKRLEIWAIFEEFQNLLNERQVRDFSTALYEARKILEAKPVKLYSSIIVDEAQDFSAGAFRFLRALAGPPHEDDLFLVGDSHQRIYKNKVCLGKCGINVRGSRGNYLRVNYRTTEETRKFAFSLLQGVSFDDLDDGYDNDINCLSLTHGDKPEVRLFPNLTEEANFVVAQINELIAEGVNPKNICLIARTKQCLGAYSEVLAQANLNSIEVKPNRADDRDNEGVRLATMHRVKGLDFQYVFLVAANKEMIPLSFALDRTDKVTYAETLTAEKCLLYVALTRAQNKAFITGYGTLSEFLA
ncbi:MAG: UvrD-helicase domain-containing protein [Deltaproteobacteria bacterium]|jgi:superfamily I DNA/RNA helicase/mRNA-degrading endonuclease RelE of RelBE toxin-antitoxin system|nr:UvrD-helicase domain-containing protein [Deltaproteobacteria bacterium]